MHMFQDKQKLVPTKRFRSRCFPNTVTTHAYTRALIKNKNLSLNFSTDFIYKTFLFNAFYFILILYFIFRSSNVRAKFIKNKYWRSRNMVSSILLIYKYTLLIFYNNIFWKKTVYKLFLIINVLMTITLHI